MVREFEALRTAVLAAIEGAGDPNAAHTAALHAQERHRAAWLALIGDLLYTAGSAGGSALIGAFQAGGASDLADYDADDDDPNALTGWIDSNKGDLADGVQQHTRGMLAALLDTALGAVGLDFLASLKQRVNDLFDGLIGQSGANGSSGNGSDYAGMLAGDWTALGWNHGEYDAVQQTTNTGVTVQRTWVAVGDAKTREAHAEADGQQVGADEPFDVGGESLMYPGDPSGSPGNVNNCRCSISYSLSGAGGAVDVSDSAEAE